MIVKAGSTDVTTYFHLRLAATGLDATGLTIADMDLQYVRSGVAPVAKVDAVALAATDTAHTDNRAIEIDATDQPGVYRVDWPDAAFATGVRDVVLTVKVATAFTESLRVELTPVASDLTLVAGTAVTAAAGIPEVKVNNIAASALTATAIASDAITAAKIATGAITSAKFAAGAIDAAALAADAATEIATAVWASATRTLTSISGLGIALATKLTKYVQLLARKDAAIATDNATEVTEINADGGSGAGAFDNITDAQEAIRDNMGTPQTGDAFARLGAPAGASIAADLVVIDNFVDDLEGRLTAARAGHLDNLSAGAVALQTSVDTLEASAAAIEADTQDIQSRLPAALTGDGNIKADALKINGATPNDLSAAGVRAAVGLASANLDAQLAALSAFVDTEIAQLVAAGLTRSGTAQAGAAGAITLDAGASAVDDYYTNQVLVITAGAGAGQARFISDYVGATKVATVATWGTNPDNTSVFAILPFGAIPGATAPTAAEVRQEIDNNSTQLAAIKAKTDNLPSDPADHSLVIVATDAIFNRLGAPAGASVSADIAARASQASVDDLPTNAELATALGTADDAVLAAIAALNNLSQANVRTAVGLASANLDAQLLAIDDFLDTEIAAIKAKTDALPADPADASDIAASFASVAATLATISGFLDTEVAAIKAKTDNLPTDPADESALEAAITAAQGVITAAITALNNLSAAQVKTQVDASIKTDAYAEPVAVPAANASIAAKLAFVFMRARNKQTFNKTTGAETVFADDGVTPVAAGTNSDDGTIFVKGEAA